MLHCTVKRELDAKVGVGIQNVIPIFTVSPLMEEPTIDLLRVAAAPHGSFDDLICPELE